ncbi:MULTISPECIES: metalloregulator ArsR/SmtB family transcription factor [Pseudoalteromonas]|jgi:DNA-binding transcriptional ArsR family regulator|uniref:ArsR family transcriptional regulator n=1 Tax=Pseudoalteromonas lipolytica TaxID=570156 RepID=A0A0P7DKP6_9GAMM|nr:MULTISPECIES: metalloregulator ArsR/SmtB family transcription factor [Pseudoalteromonas]MED5514912.1 metalloregulator ArsR/SmtB family transcription factor [Pseudomonadota bacterium]KPM81260.1 ArsR family transcriptional regulator [Pseudoalteromonas lipolytica]MBC7008680.1 winged helix-turn-helix transcriptional regulator [Pseudoalteromonas sp. BZK2]MBD55897.1 ArsR family transcriptional regulator [Pseudoalteromonas sp.]MCF2847587.1 metalloregulator ArsR/SmtB family transcription factor [Ps|tara:strand:- start:213 stop:518 length:306 start_codon:yes stop_codon:yes gene_type:complete
MNIDFAAMADNVEQAEQMLKILANKNRLMILCSLQDGEMSVSELNEAVPLAQSALSQHLAALRKAQIVATRRESQTIYYRVVDENVVSILATLYGLFCKGN